MDIMSKFNLPKYLKGKTFAEASKILDNKFKDRSDPESQSTMNDLQGRLQQAQEFVKSEQLKLSQPSSATSPTGGNSFANGGELDGNSFPEDPNELIKSFKSNQEGLNYKNPYPNRSNRWQSFQDFQKNLSNQSMNTGNSVQNNVATNANKSVGTDSSITFNGDSMRVSKMEEIIKARDEVKDNTKEVVTSLFKDRSNSLRRGGSLGEGMAKGALGTAGTGFMIGNTIAPGLGGAIGAGAGALVGAATSLIGGGEKGPSLSDRFEETGRIQKAGTNRYIKGGNLGNDINFMAANDAAVASNESGAPYDTPREKVKPLADMISRVGVQSTSTGMETELPYNPKDHVVTPSQAPSKTPKFNAGSLLRYAPSLMNLAQLSRAKESAPVGLDRINTKYDEQLVDEKSMQNTVQNSVSNNRDAILSSSGGSGSAARANLLASQLQGTKAMSQAYQGSGAENRQEGRSAQQFDLGVDQFNAGQGNRSQQINAQNEGAYESNKSKLLAQIGNDLGGIGKEELLKRYPELMGLNYGWQGKKIK